MHVTNRTGEIKYKNEILLKKTFNCDTLEPRT